MTLQSVRPSVPTHRSATPHSITIPLNIPSYKIQSFRFQMLSAKHDAAVPTESKVLLYPVLLLTTKAISCISYQAHSLTHTTKCHCHHHPLQHSALYSVLLRTLQTESLNHCKCLPLFSLDILRSFENLLAILLSAHYFDLLLARTVKRSA